MTKKTEASDFTFNISLSILNHLGRNLYRSFTTVLGEAISNSWDAYAKNVWIYVNKDEKSFCIKDDGDGMSAIDFQNKFLKIGYSKRKDGDDGSKRGRRYIGRKGIGKLALLSCAEKITVVSRVEGGEYVGGVIDNSGLDKAITNDLSPQDYSLGKWERKKIDKYLAGHSKGTVIYFENSKDEIRHSLAFLKKIVALYFRFSLIDNSFNIFINGEKVDQECLKELAQKTEFLWEINELKDPFVEGLKSGFSSEENEKKKLPFRKDVRGFVASVEKPRDLKIMTTDEKIGIDLFVNGRMRERDLLRHIPTARVVESYLYGQIHFDALDNGIDRFTSSREGVISDDPEFKQFLEDFSEKILSHVLGDWDKWRIQHKKDGDPENEGIPKKERKSRELFNLVSEDYSLPKGSKNKSKIDGWVADLASDAQYNFASYADCFISENLVRRYIEEKPVALSPEAQTEIVQRKSREESAKTDGNISIDIRHKGNDTAYLDMKHLANLVDKNPTPAGLHHDAKEYKPIRDALMHTSLLTDVAKHKLKAVYENLKGRINILLAK